MKLFFSLLSYQRQAIVCLIGVLIVVLAVVYAVMVGVSMSMESLNHPFFKEDKTQVEQFKRSIRQEVLQSILATPYESVQQTLKVTCPQCALYGQAVLDLKVKHCAMTRSAEHLLSQIQHSTLYAALLGANSVSPTLASSLLKEMDAHPDCHSDKAWGDNAILSLKEQESKE